MKDLILEALKCCFDMEIENTIICNDDEIVVCLNDGSKAKIKIKTYN